MTDTPTLDLAELERKLEYAERSGVSVQVSRADFVALVAAAKERDELRALLVRAGEYIKPLPGSSERYRALAAAITRAMKTDTTDAGVRAMSQTIEQTIEQIVERVRLHSQSDAEAILSALKARP